MDMDRLVIASVDDHVVEPPDMFARHLPRDVEQPHIVEDERGNQIWRWADLASTNIGLNAVVGRPKNEWGMEPARFDQMRRATWDVDARVDDMNAGGVFASVNFPSFTRYGKLFVERAKTDPANALRVLRAYNDWHIDEWCGAHPTRFIPMAAMPYWDPSLCVEEAKRAHAKGCHAMAFTDNPTAMDAPSIHNEAWEPFWRVCDELRLVLNCHIGSGSYPNHPSMESPIDAWITGMPIAIANSAADWVTLDALQRYPNLKMALSEGGIGWIPYLMERADFTNRHHGPWTNKTYGDKKPSDVFREHIYTCFIEDDLGLENRHKIGIENICLEVDYPHSDSVWPDIPENVIKSMNGVPGGIPDAEIDRITYLNACDLYSFAGVERAGGREHCTVGALRARAAHIDTAPVSLEGYAPKGYRPGKVVTSGDIVGLFDDNDEEASTDMGVAAMAKG